MCVCAKKFISTIGMFVCVQHFHQYGWHDTIYRLHWRVCRCVWPVLLEWHYILLQLKPQMPPSSQATPQKQHCQMQLLTKGNKKKITMHNASNDTGHYSSLSSASGSLAATTPFCHLQVVHLLLQLLFVIRKWFTCCYNSFLSSASGSLAATTPFCHLQVVHLLLKLIFVIHKWFACC